MKNKDHRGCQADSAEMAVLGGFSCCLRDWGQGRSGEDVPRMGLEAGGMRISGCMKF